MHCTHLVTSTWLLGLPKSRMHFPPASCMTSCGNQYMSHLPETDLPGIVLVTCHQIRIVQETVIIKESFRCGLVVGGVGQLNVATPCRTTVVTCIHDTHAYIQINCCIALCPLTWIGCKCSHLRERSVTELAIATCTVVSTHRSKQDAYHSIAPQACPASTNIILRSWHNQVD